MTERDVLEEAWEALVESRAEVERLRMESREWKYAAVENGKALARHSGEVDLAERERDEALAEVERLRGELAHAEVTERNVYQEGCRHVEAVSSERDAALSVIERVRELHQAEWSCGNPRHTNPDIRCPECSEECTTCNQDMPCDTLRALDGGEQS